MIEAAERSHGGGKRGLDRPGFPVQIDGEPEEETCFVIVAQEWSLALAVIRSLPGQRPKFFVVGQKA